MAPELEATTSQSLVLRNALFLVGAKALVVPLSILVNAVMARYLGAAEFGHFYLAGTFVTFGFLLVSWGQDGTLPAKVARDRARSGEFLGSALAWRVVSAPVVFLALAAGCHALGYPREIQVALALVALNAALAGFPEASGETIRGFERTDISAYCYVGQQLLTAILIVPVLHFGGRLPAALLVFAVATSAVGVFAARSLRPVGVTALRVNGKTVRELLADGWPFLLFGLTMALQPNIDAIFLSKLAPAEVVGWHAAARKLVGFLVFPAGALIGALYPTLCRLYEDDIADFRLTTSRALSAAATLVVPVAVGTALFADIGIRIFSREAFGPAADNLRALSPFILLVYFSMPLGSALLAAGRQKAWAAVQLSCVVVSIVLDPLLIPWFQAHMGNGGLGICVSALASEVLMVAAGVWLTPKGVFDRALGKTLLRTLVAGGAMALVAFQLSSMTSFVAAPVSVLAYVACLWAVGGLDRGHVGAIKGMLGRRLQR
jgi:O-antigen/teichoic acid export membrane protein